MEELLFFIASGYTRISNEHLKDTAGRILANGLVYEFRKFLHDYLCYEYETKITEIHLTELYDYEEALEQWEWGIINDCENWNMELYSPYIEKCGMYEWSYNMLLKIFKDKNKTDKIYEEINFCKQMHQLRPQQWELDEPYEKVLKPTTSKK